jgi:hypothetical protein
MQRPTALDGWMESWMEAKTNRNSLSEDSVLRNAGVCPANKRASAGESVAPRKK